MGSQVKTFASLYKGVLVGWLVGATTGIIYAPRQGEELRNRLRDQGQKLREQASNRLENARQRAEHLASVSTNRATEVTQQGQAVLREQRISLLSAIQGVRTGVRAFAEQGSSGSSVIVQDPAEAVSSTTGTAIQPAPPNDLSTHVENPGDLS